jgi:DNA modification methylase
MNIEERSAADQQYLDNELIITDPPYNIGYNYEGTYVDKMSREEYQELFKPMIGKRVVIIHYIESIIKDIVPILGAPDRVVNWCYSSNMKSRSWRAVAFWNIEIKWGNVRLPYQDMKDKRVRELFQRTGGRALSDTWNIQLVKNVSKEKIEGYTNQIPEEVISRIIRIAARPGDVIVDPFAGTGTTAAVAMKLDRQYRTADINPVALQLTEARLSIVQREMESRLF